MAETGQRVGDYEVMAPLGAGGMGRVYKVRNVISNREEAMKILLPDFAADPDLAARFMAEIRTLAGLDHPGIAQLRTAFQHNNQFVMVMEFVEGTTLEKLASQVRIPLDHIIDYSMQVLAALSYAHGKGVTHRDIKPANIMITTHGVIKLMDFGIAKSTGDMQLTRPGSTMGSVYYMSPEQVRGGMVDGRSDIYSFGVTLYEMLTGRRPFQADTTYSVLNQQVNQPPIPPVEINPDISQELNYIVLRAMAKNPEERFQTADAFRSALKGLSESAAAAPPTAALPPSMTPVPQPTRTPQQFATQPPAYATQPPSYPAQPPTDPSQPPPFTPVPSGPWPPAAPASPRRGLWIGLGAGTAILALVAVAWLLPRLFSTNASQKPADTSTPAVTAPASSAPAQAPDATPASPAVPQAPANEPQASSPAGTSAPGGGEAKPSVSRPAVASNPAGAAGARPAAKPRPAYVPAPEAAPASSGSSAAASTPAEPAGPSASEIREARERYANLEVRADTALSGVDQIRSQQRAQGLDIRGDILASVNRLHHQLDMAQQALGQKDLDTANDSMNRAEAETTRLEKFLGR